MWTFQRNSLAHSSKSTAVGNGCGQRTIGGGDPEAEGCLRHLEAVAFGLADNSYRQLT